MLLQLQIRLQKSAIKDFKKPQNYSKQVNKIN